MSHTPVHVVHARERETDGEGDPYVASQRPHVVAYGEGQHMRRREPAEAEGVCVCFVALSMII